MIQTALKWLLSELPTNVRLEHEKLFKRALEIEKEQIIHAHKEGHDYYGINTDDHVQKLAKTFYLENYTYEQDS